MICPECKAEYREGFTVCADCDVPLLQKYETGAALTVPEAPAAPGDPEKDPFCAFWQGDHARLHAELGSILDEAGIPYKTVRRQDHLFNLNNYPAFQIGVPFSLYERAERAVKEAFDLDAADPDAVQSLTAPRLLPQSARSPRKLPASLSPPIDEAIPGPPTAGEPSGWFPEDATANVWSGDDPYLQDMLIASLNENEIHCRRGAAEEQFIVSVRPEDESRAREIVREVIEANPIA
jgi:hypothetical protein